MMEFLFAIRSNVFGTVTEEILDNLYFSHSLTSTHLTREQTDLIKHQLKGILSQCNYDVNHVSDYISSKRWPEDKVASFLSILTNRKTDLLYMALINCNSAYGDTVIDFDWLLKMVIGTSELKTLKYPVVQLLLSVLDSNGQKKMKNFDIRKDMLLKLINILESENT